MLSPLPLLDRRSNRLLAPAALGVLLALLAPLTAAAKPAGRPRAAGHIRRSALHSKRAAGTTTSVKTRSVRPGKSSGGGSGKVVAPTPPAPVASSPPPAGGKGTTPSEGGETPAEGGSRTLPTEAGEVVGDPIDPRFLTDVPFGTRSFWLQPWRAYTDTLPASRLQEALGVNFPTNPAQADATAQLLHDSGFTLARIGINWDALSYAEPTVFRPSNLASITTRLSAMREHGLRPLIVLNANSDAPGPLLHVKLETLTTAAAGAQSVTLSASSAAQVIPGKTGFNNLSFGGSPDILITSVNSRGVATLSRPLLHPLAAGSHGGTTLRYAPFQIPTLAGGEPNPEFQATLNGWLGYVRSVGKLAASIMGPGGYDIEVWNELTFGSQFLNAEHYYSQATPSPEASPEAEAEAETGSEAEADAASERESEAQSESEAEESSEVQSASAPPTNSGLTKRQVNKQIRKALLSATVAFIRDPANGIPSAVGITDGFASQTPFPSGADAPLGLTALSKHPYTGPKRFPAAYRWPVVHPVNALGLRDTSSRSSNTPLFIPNYQALFPEYWLTATSTATLVRDLSPFTTEIYGFPHGREVGPVGGTPVQKWITEFNLAAWHGAVMGPDEITPQTGGSATLSTADRAHFQAKVALRSLVSNVNKGMAREYFFTASPGAHSLISSSFFTELAAHHGAYPGDQAGGETMSAMHAMLTQFQGPGPGSAARQLTLRSISQEGNHAQFAGDGSSAHPSLYDRNVLAVLPFQSSPTRYVIPVYVMTRDMLTLYEPGASAGNIHRFDLPNENFKVTLGNLPETSSPPTVTAYDPLLGHSTSARLVSREGSSDVFEFAATDYPRMLTIQYPEA